MDREQVTCSPWESRAASPVKHKDGDEYEDWIYGDPPGKITFVTFTEGKVVRVKEAYADIGGTTASPVPVR